MLVPDQDGIWFGTSGFAVKMLCCVAQLVCTVAVWRGRVTLAGPRPLVIASTTSGGSRAMRSRLPRQPRSNLSAFVISLIEAKRP